MNTLSTTRLLTFVAVAECGGFRRAAEQLHRSQSAISAHIRQLEAELGVPLFHRTTRRVSLTAEGERLLARARRALAELQAGVRELRDEADLQRGRVVIGVPPTISSTRLPRIVAAFQQRYPGIAVQIREDFAANILERVRREELDFAIAPRVEGAQAFTFEPILRDAFRVVLPPGDHRAGAPEIALAGIADAPFLALPPATALRRALDEAWRSQGRVLTPAFEVMHHLTLLAMVEAGLGVTVLPALCLPAAGTTTLQTARLVEPALAREISLTTLRGQALSPAAAACAEMVRDGFAA